MKAICKIIKGNYCAGWMKKFSDWEQCKYDVQTKDSKDNWKIRTVKAKMEDEPLTSIQHLGQ